MLFPNLCLGQWFWRKNVVSKPLLGAVFFKRNAFYKDLFRTICLQNSAVSKLLLGAVFFQEKCFFQICFKQFCLKGKCCFQTSAWGQWFWKRSAVCKPLLGAVFFKGTAVSELLLEAVCLKQFCLTGKCCFQTSAWGIFFKTSVPVFLWKQKISMATCAWNICATSNCTWLKKNWLAWSAAWEDPTPDTAGVKCHALTTCSCPGPELTAKQHVGVSARCADEQHAPESTGAWSGLLHWLGSAGVWAKGTFQSTTWDFAGAWCEFPAVLDGSAFHRSTLLDILEFFLPAAAAGTSCSYILRDVCM